MFRILHKNCFSSYHIVCMYVPMAVCMYVTNVIIIQHCQPVLNINEQVLEEQVGQVFLPIRDPAHRHYISAATYPDDVLPPLALGNFYLLSMDLVRLIARNDSAAGMQPVGSLEDLSVAMWLRQLKVCMYVCMYV